ncbi:MAG TPA: M56 family metallopeptidase [Actinocatenispora sp.]
MIPALLVCLGAGALFGLLAAPLGRRVAPRPATWLLTLGSVLTAGASAFALAATALLWIGQLAPVAALGDWSASTLHHTTPVPPPVAAAAGVALVALLVSAVACAVSRGLSVYRSYRTFAGVAAPGQVAVLDSPVPEAFATPEPAGRIIVTSALVGVLDDGERRALIAHERSHLLHRHAWWRIAAELAAAANPLLRPAAGVVRDAVERWADEDAAAAVGDRRVVARAISRAALARRRAPVTAASGGQVPQRVRALLAPVAPRRPALAVVLVVLLAVTAAGALAVEHTGDAVFDHAAVSAGRD